MLMGLTRQGAEPLVDQELGKFSRHVDWRHVGIPSFIFTVCGTQSTSRTRFLEQMSLYIANRFTVARLSLYPWRYEPSAVSTPQKL